MDDGRPKLINSAIEKPIDKRIELDSKDFMESVIHAHSDWRMRR